MSPTNSTHTSGVEGSLDAGNEDEEYREGGEPQDAVDTPGTDERQTSALANVTLGASAATGNEFGLEGQSTQTSTAVTSSQASTMVANSNAGATQRKAVAVVFVIDGSSSMQDNHVKVIRSIWTLARDLTDLGVAYAFSLIPLTPTLGRYKSIATTDNLRFGDYTFGGETHEQSVMVLSDGLGPYWAKSPRDAEKWPLSKWFSSQESLGTDFETYFQYVVSQADHDREYGLASTFASLSLVDFSLFGQVEIVVLSDEDNDSGGGNLRASYPADSIGQMFPQLAAPLKFYMYHEPAPTTAQASFEFVGAPSQRLSWTKKCLLEAAFPVITDKAASLTSTNLPLFLNEISYSYFCTGGDDPRGTIGPSNLTGLSQCDVAYMDCVVPSDGSTIVKNTIVRPPNAISCTQRTDQPVVRWTINPTIAQLEDDYILTDVSGCRGPMACSKIQQHLLFDIGQGTVTQAPCSAPYSIQDWGKVESTQVPAGTFVEGNLPAGITLTLIPGPIRQIAVSMALGIPMTATTWVSASAQLARSGFGADQQTTLNMTLPDMDITSVKGYEATAEGFVAAMRSARPDVKLRWHSIVNLDGLECPGSGSTGNHVKGTEYIKLANLTDGIVGNVCDPSYDGFVSLVGQRIQTQ